MHEFKLVYVVVTLSYSGKLTLLLTQTPGTKFNYIIIFSSQVRLVQIHICMFGTVSASLKVNSLHFVPPVCYGRNSPKMFRLFRKFSPKLANLHKGSKVQIPPELHHTGKGEAQLQGEWKLQQERRKSIALQ